jgi:hypothetical protein
LHRQPTGWWCILSRTPMALQEKTPLPAQFWTYRFAPFRIDDFLHMRSVFYRSADEPRSGTIRRARRLICLE